MTQQPTTTSASEAVAVGDVYVLTEHMSEGDTVLYITTSLDDAQTFHARNPIRTQVQPWEPVIVRSEIDDEPHTWIARPAGTGGYGAVYYIVKTPLHAPLGIASDVLTDALAGIASSADKPYRPWMSEVAPGVTSFPAESDPDHNPDEDHASAAFEAEQDRIEGEVWKWLNRHDAPWSPSDAKVSDLVYAIANGQPTFADTEPAPKIPAAPASRWVSIDGVRILTRETPDPAGPENPIIRDALDYYAERRPMNNPKGWDHVRRIVESAISGDMWPNATPEQITQARATLAALTAAEGTGTPDDPARATTADVQAFRQHFYIDVPEVTDADLMYVMNYMPDLLATARLNGWNDTEVRDRFSTALEAQGYTLD